MFIAIQSPLIDKLLYVDFTVILSVYTGIEIIKFLILEVTSRSRKYFNLFLSKVKLNTQIISIGEDYVLYEHARKKIFRNPSAPEYLMLYFSVMELCSCVIAFSYFVIMY